MNFHTQNLTLAYGNSTIIENLDLEIMLNKITVLVGANGCGKSTLLKALSRLLKPSSGDIILDGKAITQYNSQKLAKLMAVLPQGVQAQERLTVHQLVSMGRYPHQNWLKQWAEIDEKAVIDALTKTNLVEFQEREVNSLSGGQRQRAWIAMTLAQDSDILLLDEPTTYLDLTHQIEILDLLYNLNREAGKTVIMVLHDLNLACRYADYILAVAEKTIIKQGKPEDIITVDSIKKIFNLDCQIIKDPIFETPLCIPYGRGLYP